MYVKKFLIIMSLLSLTGLIQTYAQEGDGLDIPIETPTAGEAVGALGEADLPDFGVGLEFGAMTIGGVDYNFVRLQPKFSLGKFKVGLDLNFEFDGEGKFRTEEWTSWQAILAKFRYIGWEEKGGMPIYARIGSIDDFTLGHGLIMNRYSNMLDYPDIKKLGLALDLNTKFFGFETVVGNILDFDVLGGRLYARPLAFMAIPIVKTIEVGISAVLDLDPQNPFPSPEEPYKFTDSTNSANVSVYGFDLGAIIFANPIINMLAYFDFVGISGKGTGEILGVAGNIATLVPYKLEARILQAQFTPNYFNTYYDADRSSKYEALSAITNGYAGWMFSSGIVVFEGKLVFGFQIDASFGSTEFSTDFTKPNLTLDLKLSKELLKKFGFKVTYMRKSITGWSDVFKMDDPRSILLAEVEYLISEKLSIKINYKMTYVVNSDGVVEQKVSTSIDTGFNF